MRALILLTGLCASLSAGLARPAWAQQPFVVDDADVTAPGIWHLEVSSQVDGLRRSARPARWQHALEWELDLGVTDRLEVGAVVPVISLVSDGAGGRVAAHGLGDSTLAAKYRFTRDAAARTSVAASVSLEMPTGSRARQLGSGLVDYGINGVVQRRLHPRAMGRVNGGMVLAGNTQVGALGIKVRGPVLTAGASMVAAASPRLQVGGELTGAWSQKATLAGSTLGWQVGANLALRDGVTLDASVLGGWLAASPRLGAQVGTSIDFHR